MPRIRNGRLITAALTMLAVVAAPVLTAPVAARADTPDPQVADPFVAPPCPGEISGDLENADGNVPNLLLVFGQRLADYNAGKVVLLHSNGGTNTTENYIPPSCGTRYVESVGGPVSEWMYCTDLDSHTCGGTDAEGHLLNQDGERIDGMGYLPGNPRLTRDQEKLIAYLIKNGHEYDNPNFFSEVSFADPYGNGQQRAALQLLLWCISDPGSMAAWNGPGTACVNSMDAAEQARLLALIPDDPVIEIDLGGPSVTLAPGETAEITLRTNLYEQPIALTSSGLTGTLTVLSGDVDLGTDDIVVHGTDASVLTTVRLGFTSNGIGTVEFEASAHPDAVEHLAWAQSPGVSSSDGVPCQVYATFRSSELSTVSDRASATFADPAGPTAPQQPGGGVPGTGTGITSLPATGAEPGPAVAVAALLAGLGVLLVLARGRLDWRRPREW